VSFIVRSMVVRHHREAVYGEALAGRTWPSRFRRGLFFRRECRVESPRGPVASATQEWVHVRSDARSGELQLARASDELVSAFAVEEHDEPVTLPDFEPLEASRTHRFELECWHTWMDPLGHVNHPAYVDWCDEALSRAMAAAGLDPVRLSPVAEEASFKRGVTAGERVAVETRLVGQAHDAAVFEHRVSVAETACARVVTVRRLAGEPGESALLALG
jgi:acyl-CoA thioesterase FadM